MGLVGWLRDKAIAHQAEKAGEGFLRKGGPMKEWLRQWINTHKTQIGAAFGAAWLWATVSGCPPLLGYPIAEHISCEHLRSILLALGTAGVAGGVLQSDAFHRDKRDRENSHVAPPKT